MQSEWGQFTSETKKLISTYLQLAENREEAKLLISNLFGTPYEDKCDLIAVLRIIRSSNDKRERTVAGLMAFLWFYELGYVRCLDIFCYLLVGNGHDLFDTLRKKYAKDLKNIGKVDVYTKLNFLQEHKFGLLRRPNDETLRNKIAHHDFIIDDSDKVIMENKEIDVNERLNGLFRFDTKIIKIYSSCLDLV
jgi:hypothetical protein